MLPWKRLLVFVLILLREVFIELKQTVTKSVEFSFNNVMYRQIDNVAMSFHFDPTSANIFAGCYESLLFGKSEEIIDVPALRGRYFCCF